MKNLLLASSCLLFANLAIASSNNGVYISSKIGVSVLNIYDSKFEYSNEKKSDFRTLKFNDKSHPAFGNFIGIGYDFYDQFSVPVRTEVEVGMRGKVSDTHNLNALSGSASNSGSSDMKNEATLTTVMLNSYYDMKNQTAFTPYISFGLGLASTRYENTQRSEFEIFGFKQSSNQSKSDRINKLAWSLGLGSRYAFNDNLSFDLGYRFTEAGKYKISMANALDKNATETSTINLASHDFMFGIAYRF
ncbi:porin family protein [Providencia sp. JGM172]|uniref:outer membrane protein n=2 Tax=Providencia TaxID=586 RepID=UPI001BAD8EBA|nr:MULTISPECIES: outer membrane beta-barrel protein [unclassified Providencia]MBS0934732.1 porin family protein [Providencia sp. JGM172]MBS0998324.1 porin family protein [Providencia sp. JGM178]